MIRSKDDTDSFIAAAFMEKDLLVLFTMVRKHTDKEIPDEVGTGYNLSLVEKGKIICSSIAIREATGVSAMGEKELKWMYIVSKSMTSRSKAGIPIADTIRSSRFTSSHRILEVLFAGVTLISKVEVCAVKGNKASRDVFQIDVVLDKGRARGASEGLEIRLAKVDIFIDLGVVAVLNVLKEVAGIVDSSKGRSRRGGCKRHVAFARGWRDSSNEFSCLRRHHSILRRDGSNKCRNIGRDAGKKLDVGRKRRRSSSSRLGGGRELVKGKVVKAVDICLSLGVNVEGRVVDIDSKNKIRATGFHEDLANCFKFSVVAKAAHAMGVAPCMFEDTSSDKLLCTGDRLFSVVSFNGQAGSTF